ncbi:hypothetical protein VNO78_25957 [Psophocarpus tetragonolobus]|uniref:Uncharacterized protein n=1 Tax=Psophocarpus tetragonolobus TaxID=3891 RepID=A0AAN9XG90_PSOTE
MVVEDEVDGSSKPTSFGVNVEYNAYTLIEEVMKKSLTIAPTHCEVFVTELDDRAAMLRVLQALSSLVTLLTEKEKYGGTPTLSKLDANHDSSIPIIFYVEYACTFATPQKTSRTVVKVDEKNVAFVRF